MSLILIPKAGHVLIQPIAPAPASAGNIVLADVTYESETKGVVVEVAAKLLCEACGSQRESELQKGDVVLFSPGAGDEADLFGTRYLVLRESEVWAVLSEVTA